MTSEQIPSILQVSIGVLQCYDARRNARNAAMPEHRAEVIGEAHPSGPHPSPLRGRRLRAGEKRRQVARTPGASPCARDLKFEGEVQIRGSHAQARLEPEVWPGGEASGPQTFRYAAGIRRKPAPRNAIGATGSAPWYP